MAASSHSRSATDVILGSDKLTRKIMDHGIILKAISDEGLGIGRIRAVAWKIWPTSEVHLVGHNLFFVLFQSKPDKDSVIHQQPWVISGVLLTIWEWPPLIAFESVPINVTQTWVNLQGIRVDDAKDKRCIAGIGALFSSILEHEVTKDPDDVHVRMRVNIDVTKPLLPGCRLVVHDGDESLIFFRYEKLPTCCYNCGLLGHLSCNYSTRDKRSSIYGNWMFFTDVSSELDDDDFHVLPNPHHIFRRYEDNIKRKKASGSDGTALTPGWCLGDFSVEQLRTLFIGNVRCDKYHRWDLHTSRYKYDDDLLKFVFSYNEGPSDSALIQNWEEDMMGKSNGNRWISLLTDLLREGMSVRRDETEWYSVTLTYPIFTLSDESENDDVFAPSQAY